MKAERDEAQAHYRFMVERAADEKLDGYRELGARAAKAENERDDLRAWVARAVEALTLALKAYVGGASCRACGAPNDAHYSTCPTNALRAVLADAPKEMP